MGRTGAGCVGNLLSPLHIFVLLCLVVVLSAVCFVAGVLVARAAQGRLREENAWLRGRLDGE